MANSVVDQRYLGIADIKEEGALAPDAEYRELSDEERAEQDAEFATFTKFALRMADELNPGDHYYEVSPRQFVKDIMKIEAALREEIDLLERGRGVS